MTYKRCKILGSILLAALFASLALTMVVFAESAGFNSPTANATRAGAVQFPDNAHNSNDTYAVFPDGEAQDYKTYGFSIPSGSTINGIEVAVEHQHKKDTDTGFVTIQLLDENGSQFGTAKVGADDGHTADTTETLGGSTDTWGAALTDTITNNANFGVSILYTKTAGGGGNKLNLDSITIKVYYTGSGGGGGGSSSSPGGGGGGTVIIYPPPLITSIKISNKNGVAVIEFNTSEPSTGQIFYGTEPYYLNKYFQESEGAVVSHHDELLDIDMGTVYYFKIIEVSQRGVSAESDVQTLDFAPPVAENIHIVSVATSSAEIAWTTNEPTTAKVRYGKTTNLRSVVETNESAKSHNLVMAGLEPRTQYFFRIESIDAYGNLAIGRLRTFITLGEADDSIILPPTDFSVARQDKNIVLNWRNPIDNGFSFVVLLKKSGEQPRGYFDGQILYNGSGETFTVQDEIGAEYAIYAVDRDGNFSQMVFANPDEFRYDIYLRGQTLPEIKTIQGKLKILGFFPTRVALSDWFGPITEQSVKRFQKSIGAKQNGILTEYQHDVLIGDTKGSQWSLPQNEKRQGSSGDDVGELQQFLRDFGFFPFDARPSGYFGPITRRALLEYQRTNNIPLTGVFDLATREYTKDK